MNIHDISIFAKTTKNRNTYATYKNILPYIGTEFVIENFTMLKMKKVTR